MQGKYEPGQSVYIIQSNRWIREATVLKFAGGMYTIRFSEGGGTRLRESRLFESKEAAEEYLKTHSTSANSHHPRF